MLHGATAKLMFLVFWVVSFQRGAPFLMYGMVDSSFISNELCVCVHSKNSPLQEGDTDASFLSGT